MSSVTAAWRDVIDTAVGVWPTPPDIAIYSTEKIISRNDTIETLLVVVH